ncbi:hypothetical protein GN244_ATG01825 [Phytophthora infestans]|nr:hypothetical protein GN244_ATG01825 [Phytophthora infestans]
MEELATLAPAGSNAVAGDVDTGDALVAGRAPVTIAGEGAGSVSGVGADKGGRGGAAGRGSAGRVGGKVAAAGRVPTPTSDDYNTWSVEQLRKECTSRNLRLSRQTSAEERIKHLVGFDELHRSMVASTLESGGGTGNSKAYPSKNSCVRLLTILFSDKYATRFAETGNKPTRQQLDASDTHANSIFWRDVALDFNGNRMDFNTLLSDDVRFAWFDCSVIVVQEVGTLYDM